MSCPKAFLMGTSAEPPVPAATMITLVFEGDSCILVAKIVNGKHYSILSDYPGVPFAAYDDAGVAEWSCELDIYGKVRKLGNCLLLVMV